MNAKRLINVYAVKMALDVFISFILSIFVGAGWCTGEGKRIRSDGKKNCTLNIDDMSDTNLPKVRKFANVRQ